MSTVYGPVPSWRLGRSLGIDVLLPPKKCTFNCIYCQLGKTRMHVSRPEMISEPLVDAKKVAKDLDWVLKRLDLDSIDIATFSGTGEPTLNLGLGEIAKDVRRKVGSVPLAILTNSSLFQRRDIRKNLSLFDLIVAKLDAGDDETFQLINRPADKTIDLETIVDSIRILKKTVKGTLAIEVMFLHSRNGHITNIKGNSFKNLLKAIVEIDPDQVQLEVPFRPPSESYIEPPLQPEIELVANELSKTLGEERLWVHGLNDRRGRSVTWLCHENLVEELVELLKRRPCCVDDISASLGITPLMARRLIKRLSETLLATRETSKGVRYHFYTHKEE